MVRWYRRMRVLEPEMDAGIAMMNAKGWDILCVQVLPDNEYEVMFMREPSALRHDQQERSASNLPAPQLTSMETPQVAKLLLAWNKRDTWSSQGDFFAYLTSCVSKRTLVRLLVEAQQHDTDEQELIASFARIALARQNTPLNHPGTE